MKKCKKFKSNASPGHFHHLNPQADCHSCVYFSQNNCGANLDMGTDNLGFM